MKKNIILSIITTSVFLILPSAFGQGSLIPPGPPGPTMLTLSQVEPRTPISSAPYAITQSGSYYLATNLVASSNAIVIFANGVTLDLSGFSISSTAASATGTAILVNGALTNIAIYNGHINGSVTNNSSGTFSGGGFANGIFIANNSYNIRIRDISVYGVLDNGIDLGQAQSTTVETCVVNEAGDYGIAATTVSDSSAFNVGLYGIYCQTANNCNVTTMGNGEGISAGNVVNCISDCTGNAFAAIFATTVENCTGENGGTGIQAQTVENSYGYSSGSSEGLECQIAKNSYGESTSGNGIIGSLVENCYGYSMTGTASGIYVYYDAENSFGQSNGNGAGIYGDGTVANCNGYSYGSSDGIYAAGTAIGCYGYSGSGYGIYSVGTAIGCFGDSNTGTGLYAFIANVCHGSTSSGTALSTSHNVNSY